MKKIYFAAILFLSSMMVFAQDNQDNRNNTNNSDNRSRNGNRNEAPASVQEAWQRDHASDGNPTWQQSNGQWHAQYQDKTNNRKVDTYYDQRGHQVDTHRQWSSSDMPSEYSQSINKRYHTNGNYDITRIDRPNQKEVYQLNVKNKGRKKTIYTDNKGREIKYRDTHKND